MDQILKRIELQADRIERYMSTKATCMEYQEILRLAKMLEKAEIPYRLHTIYDGWQVIYPDVDCPVDAVCDAVESFMSYGMEDDLLELKGLLTEEEEKNDAVLGHLTAQDVFNRIEKHWKETEK